MPHSCALFRVTSTSRNERGVPLIRLQATYSTRDGKQSEINKQFSKWTPGGELELTREYEGEPVFAENEYVRLDLYAPPEAAPAEPPAGTIRTRWWLSRFEVDAQTGPCFYARAYPVTPDRGHFNVQVTNMDPELLALYRLEPGAEPREIVIDLSVDRSEG